MASSLQVLKVEFEGALRNLNALHTQMRPLHRESAWSIQQIAEHLLLTYDSTAETLQARLNRGVATKKRPTTLQRAAQSFVFTTGKLPRGRKAPEEVWPCPDAVVKTGTELSALVRSGLDHLEALTLQCEERFGRGRSVTHAILGPLSMDQWRRFHLIHGRHHIKQITAIRHEHRI